MSIQKDNDAMARLYTESVDTTALVPKQGVDTLDEYLDGLVGMSIKDVLDKESYLSLYMMNKNGIMGASSGDEKDLMEFSSAVTAFVNRKVHDHRPLMGDREYLTQEFKDKHNFDEYESLKQSTRINPIRIRREQGVEAYDRAKQQMVDARAKMRDSDYGKAMQALESQYDQAVKDYHNTSMSKEYLSNDGSPQYQKLENMFNRLVGGQSAKSEYDTSDVIDVSSEDQEELYEHNSSYDSVTRPNSVYQDMAELYTEGVQGKEYDKCWDGYKKVPGKKRGEPGSCEKAEDAEDKHKASNPGILSRQIKGKITCSKAKSLKSSTKDKGSNTAKAAQRFINYHDCDEEEWSNEDAEERLAGLPEEDAEYRGRKVTLNKPTRGDVKKFKVYVKDPKTGNVKKVNFGDPNMRIRKSNPGARKSFRARHKCDQKKDKTTAGYWSCKKW